MNIQKTLATSFALATIIVNTALSQAAPTANASAKSSTATMASAVEKAVLLSGTKIKLELAEPLSSNKAEVGQEVTYYVKEDVVSDKGELLIRKGAKAIGKVTAAKGAKMFGKKGKLEFTVEEVEAVDGGKVLLRSSVEKAGKGRGGTMVAVTALVTIFGVFIKGKNVTVPQGTLVEAFVDENTAIAPGEVAPLAVQPAATITPVPVVQR